MSLIARETLDEIRARLPIEEVVASYLPLRRGGNSLKACCPFHAEKTPSFHVNPQRQIFKCFGCGQGGDLFTFVSLIENCGFGEAVDLLARRAGVELQRTRSSGPNRVDLLRALAWAQGLFRAAWHAEAGADARAYVARRGLSEATSEAFGFGLCPGGGTWLVQQARQARVPEEVLVRSGLAAPSASGRLRDRFWDRRWTMPIATSFGEVVAFGGRTLEGGEPKYLNSPESALFRKSEVLFGLDKLPKGQAEGPICVVEGYTDVMAAHQAGLDSFVATLGTALTPQHARRLARHRDRIVLLFDGDAAGLRAAARGVEVLLREGHHRLEVALLPPGQDPCDWFLERGAEGLEPLLAEARDLVEFCLEHAETSGAGREEAAQHLLGVVAGVEDAVLREMLAERVGRRLGVPPHVVERSLRQRERRPVRPAREPSPPAALAREAPSAVERGLLRHAKWIVAALVNRPELSRGREIARFLPQVPAGPVRDLLGAILDLLAAGCSRTTQILDGLEESGRCLAEKALRDEEGLAELEPRLVEALARLEERAHKEDAARLRPSDEECARDPAALQAWMERVLRLKGARRGEAGGDEPGGGHGAGGSGSGAV